MLPEKVRLGLLPVLPVVLTVKVAKVVCIVGWTGATSYSASFDAQCPVGGALQIVYGEAKGDSKFVPVHDAGS